MDQRNNFDIKLNKLQATKKHTKIRNNMTSQWSANIHQWLECHLECVKYYSVTGVSEFHHVTVPSM